MSRAWCCMPLCLLLVSDRPATPALAGPPNVVAKSTAEAPLVPLPTSAEMERLAGTNPVAFLEAALRRYDREIKTLRYVLHKQEFINGRLYPAETIEVAYRERPRAVLMKWVEGARLAEAVLWVEGENDGMMLARPQGSLARLAVGKVVRRDPDGADARATSRYSIKEAGPRNALERTLKSWKAAQERNILTIRYRGIDKIKETGGRPCYVFEATFSQPQTEGTLHVTVYVDTETWLQTGSVLRGAQNRLLGAYFFRDVQVNPPLRDDQFRPSALER
ncbi:MAG: DUF1571 domain-containing protein [Gemmataceae bacterium]|nr:DUF1571 domain-containing protein [Gemmataceae bacterium]MDW8263889.1 DUF1571 domain-containing protein [Gemmataceae bacterium]